jgi:hypothetical protein
MGFATLRRQQLAMATPSHTHLIRSGSPTAGKWDIEKDLPKHPHHLDKKQQFRNLLKRRLVVTPKPASKHISWPVFENAWTE